MRYIVDFSVAAFCYLSITAVAYFRQPKAAGRRQGLYGALLALGLLGLVLDVAAAALDGQGAQTPLWLHYAVNLLFLLTVQASGYLFFLYAMVLLGLWRERRPLLAALPFLTVAALLFCSLFSRAGIFWIDEAGGYHHGATHIALYVASGTYLLLAMVCLLHRRKAIRARKRFVIYAFILLTLSAMGIQLMAPDVLVNSMAMALALTMMYYALEAPNEHIDPLTGTLNNAAFAARMKDMMEQNQRFTAIGFQLDSLPVINETMGERKGDQVLIDFAAVLRGCFPHGEVVRFLGSVFAVLIPDPVRDAKEMEAVQQRVADAWRAREDVSMAFWCFGANSEGFDAPEDMTGFLYSMLEEYLSGEHVTQGTASLLADEAYCAGRIYRAKAEAALNRALDNDALMVYYQPMHSPDGQLVALEALVRLKDEQMGFISPELFVRLAEQNGSIHRLGMAILRKTCAFIAQNGLDGWGLEHVGVNLSVEQCMEEDLPEKLDAMVREAGVRPGLLGLELTETEVASSMPMMRQNMLALSQRGYRFLLDDFGSGNANFNYILRLPFSSVKIDKCLLWGVEENETQRALLTGICAMLRRLEMHTVCEGVETQAHHDLLESLGVEQLQGYYYSKPLPPEQLLAYAAPYLGTASGKEARA